MDDWCPPELDEELDCELKLNAPMQETKTINLYAKSKEFEDQINAGSSRSGNMIKQSERKKNSPPSILDFSIAQSLAYAGISHKTNIPKPFKMESHHNLQIPLATKLVLDDRYFKMTASNMSRIVRSQSQHNQSHLSM